jgi:hypothetical protein
VLTAPRPPAAISVVTCRRVEPKGDSGRYATGAFIQDQGHHEHAGENVDQSHQPLLTAHGALEETALDVMPRQSSGRGNAEA